MKTYESWIDDLEGHEMWDQKAKFNNVERAKMMLDTLEEDDELNAEFIKQSRQRKLNKIKK